MTAELRSNNPSDRNGPPKYPSTLPESGTNTVADDLAINQLPLNQLSTNELAGNDRSAPDNSPAEPGLSQPLVTERRVVRHDRTDGTTLLALYHFGWSAVYLVGALIMAIPTMITGIVGLAEDPEIFWVTGLLGVATFFILGLSLLFFVVGFGLWRLRQWARTAAIAIAFVSLPTVIGTIPAALTLWYLFKEEVSSIFR